MTRSGRTVVSILQAFAGVTHPDAEDAERGLIKIVLDEIARDIYVERNQRHDDSERKSENRQLDQLWPICPCRLPVLERGTSGWEIVETKHEHPSDGQSGHPPYYAARENYCPAE